jgi:cytochrome c oxidase cbb3-type subunit 3
MNQEEKPIQDHDYDGIREFDYPAPFWWQLSFYLSIIFAIGYYAYYEIGNGTNSDERLKTALVEIERVRIANKPQGPDLKALAALASDGNAIKSGKEHYVAKCAACHGPDGGGLVGPNLTDRHWIHGKGELGDIHQVVANGVLDKGMPAWSSLMSDPELNSVVVFVKSLAGSHPAHPKGPQGTEVP